MNRRKLAKRSGHSSSIEFTGNFSVSGASPISWEYSMQTRLSKYGQASSLGSPVNRLMAEFSHSFRDGIDINLGVGYVNENTVPVPAITEAMQAVAADPVKYRQAFNYGGSAGTANLQASLRKFLGEDRTAGKRLAIGACGATSILDALADILPPGLIITSDPAYYIYADALERKGFELVAVPEDAEGIDIHLLERKLEEIGLAAARISFIYVVTVNNPSATVLSNQRRRELYDVAARLSKQQNRRIPIVYDLAYELLLHDPEAERFESALPGDDLSIAYEIGTLSKILAPAMRIGYILGPDGPLLDALVQRTTDGGLSAPVFVQEMAGYMLEHHIEEQLQRVNAGYREKALATAQAIEQCLGPLIEERRGGRAGFYYYLTFRTLETHPESAYFRILTRTTGDPALDGPPSALLPRVVYIPGTYCVQAGGDLAEKGKRQLRISYGFESIPRIVQALELMRDAAAQA
jgi:2-aminoadipate transaminase